MIKLIHDITQLGYKVIFQDDFEGMIEVTYQDSEDSYIRHEHLSYPGGSIDKLAAALEKSLTLFLDEIKKGKPKKDNLADFINKKKLD